MHRWLSDAADTLAREADVPREDLELSAGEIDALLRAAGAAAHESGARTNAPLLCFLLGRAAARAGDVERLAATVEGAVRA